MAWSATTALLLNYGRPRLSMRELSEVLGITYTYINNVAASGGCPVKTYVEGGKRWADIRDVGEYLDRKREEAA